MVLSTSTNLDRERPPAAELDEHPLTPSTRVITHSGSVHGTFPNRDRGSPPPRSRAQVGSTRGPRRPRAPLSGTCQAAAEELHANVWFTRRSPRGSVRRNLALVVIDTTPFPGPLTRSLRLLHQDNHCTRTDRIHVAERRSDDTGHALAATAPLVSRVDLATCRDGSLSQHHPGTADPAYVIQKPALTIWDGQDPNVGRATFPRRRAAPNRDDRRGAASTTHVTTVTGSPVPGSRDCTTGPRSGRRGTSPASRRGSPMTTHARHRGADAIVTVTTIPFSTDQKWSRA